MKVAFAIFKWFPFGGLQKDFLRIAEAVHRRGHETICFTGEWSGERPDFLKIEIVPLNSRSNHARAEEFEQAFGNFLKREKPDRSVAFNLISGADFYFAGNNCYASEFAKRGNPFLKLFPRYRTFLRLEKRLLSPDNPTKILYIVESQKRDYIRFYGSEPERFLALPPAGNPACVRPSDAPERRTRKRAELHLTDNTRMFLQIGSDFHQKGADRTIAAFAALPPEIRKNCMLYLIGATSLKRRMKFIRLAERLGVAEQTVFPGPLTNQLPDYLFAADMMVHPARQESAGSVLVEGLAAGLPVICTENCGFSTLVRDASCPVLPDPFNQIAFNKLFENAIFRMDELKHAALEYSKTLDFHQREEIATDAILRS